jgi:adenylate cyclase
MPDLFISYSRKDSEQALGLTARLRDQGVDVWIDQHGIEVAASWSKEIVKAIDDSKVFAVLISTNSMESANVTKEVSIACEAQKKILPIAIEDIRLNDDLRYHLAGIQRVAYTQFDAIRAALHGFGIDAKRATGKPAGPARKSIMVLPFEDLSPTQDNGWFTDGMASELISSLTKVKALRVIDWNTSKLFKERKVKTSDLAKELEVRYFIEGSVRKFEDQIKIAVSFLDFETGDHLWQDSLKGAMKDVFEIQESVAAKVVSGLKVHLDPDEVNTLRKRGTENDEAYELYLKASEYFGRHTRTGFEFAIQLLTRALELDPNFVEAMRRMPIALTELYRAYKRDPALLAEAEVVAKRALELDPASAIALFGLSIVYQLQGDLARAEDAAQEYVRREPENPGSHYALGWFYASTGQPKRALAPFERSIELGSESLITYQNLVATAGDAGDTAREKHWARLALPHYERRLRLLPDDENIRITFANFLQQADEPERAKEALSFFRDRKDLDARSFYNIACTYARIAEPASAINALRAAVQGGFMYVEGFRSDPDLDPLREIPDFQELLSTVESKQDIVESKQNA